MGKSIRSRIIRFGIAFSAIILSFFSACEIGLGAAVDTEAPSIDIVTPPVDSIVRNEFALKGTWDDDGSIEGVTVTLKRTDGYGTPSKYEATVTDVKGKKDWFVVLNSEESPILDGAYEATVEIADTAGHKLSQTRTFSIDNTPPLIILQRPGTKLNETPDAYGQTFSLNGMGADDNSIDHIDVEIFSDAACTNLLKKITKSNVPPTIELDVAVFEDGVANDYSEIYGSTSKNGTQNRYCKITAYDNAKSYPANSDEVDETGNKTSVYYLYDDIYTGILENHSAAEVYKMLSGTWIISGQGRSADQISSVKALLAQHQMSESNFSLNPENNPLFIVNGKDNLTKNGSDFTGEDYNISTGTGLVVEVSTGLDGISLDTASLRPYLLPCDAYGNATVPNISENRIYLAAAGSGTKSGTSYKFTVSLDSATPYADGKTIIIGGKYIFGVEGHDQRGNTVIPKGGAYGFILTSNGAAPGLTVTSPANTISYVGANGSQNFHGTLTCQDGAPSITITKVGTTTPVYTHTFDVSDAAVSNGLLSYSFNYTLDFNGVTENSQNQYSITASQNGLNTTITKTVIYDKDSPDISITDDNISPIAKLYDSDKDNTVEQTGNYLNGKVKIKLTISDEFDAIDTETNKPYFEVIPADAVDTDDNAALPVVVTGTDSNTVGNKHYITKLINGNFTINTSSITDGTSIRFRIVAWDRAGNKKITKSSAFVVNQASDKPVVWPGDGLTFSRTSAATNGVPSSWATSDNRKAQIPSGVKLQFYVHDDDGIKEIKVWQKLANTSDTSDTVIFGSTDLWYPETIGTATEINRQIDVSSEAGTYWYKIEVTDNVTREDGDNNGTSTFGPFIMKITTPAPTILSVTAEESDSTDVSVGKYVSSAANAIKTKWKNKVTIESSEESFELWRAEVAIPADGSTPTAPAISESSPWVRVTESLVNSKTIYDVITPSASSLTGDKGYYYYIKDLNGTTCTSAKYIKCLVDNTAPTITISSPGTGEESRTGINSINSSPYMFAGTVIEANEISSIYYQILPITSNVPSVPTGNLMDSATWINSTAGWKSITPSSNWSFSRNMKTGSDFVAEGKYKIYMFAIDGAGNLSDANNSSAGNQPYSQEFHVDMEYPSITLTDTTPIQDSYLNKDSTNFTIEANVSDSYGVDSVIIARPVTSGSQPAGWPTNYYTNANCTTLATTFTSGNVYFYGLEATETATSGINSKQFTIGSSDSSAVNYITDGTYTFTVTVKDRAGKTTSTTRRFTIDTIAPTISEVKINSVDLDANADNSSKWYRNQTIPLLVTAADTNGSGLSSVEYLTLTNSQTADDTTLADSNWTALSPQSGSYSGSAIFEGTGQNQKLYIRVKDKAGNITYFNTDNNQVTVNIDTTKPVVGNTFFYQYQWTEQGASVPTTSAATQATGQIYVNGSKDLIVYGQAYDLESGLNSLIFTIGGNPATPTLQFATTEPASGSNMTSLTYGDAPSDRKTIKYWKATFGKDRIASDECGALTVKAVNGALDTANNGDATNETSISTITFDNTAPVPSNITFTSSNTNKQPYKSAETETALTYFVSNTGITVPTFTINGIAADNCGLKDVTLTINGTAINRTSTGQTELSQWAFAGFALATSTFVDGHTYTAELKVTDLADNVATKTINLKIDTTGPKAMHWADANNKDIYFRIGNADNEKTNASTWETGDSVGNGTTAADLANTGVGSKYAFGSWGNDSTIEIRGTFDEAATGSGLKRIHYAIFNGAPTDAQITALENGTLSVTEGSSVKTIGSFDPLSTPDTKKVSYSKDATSKSSKEVITNFRTTLSGFNEINNYLVLVAEDNAGNRAADTLVITEGTAADGTNNATAISNGTSNWNSENHTTPTKYYNINKDTHAPNITSNVVNGVYTNGTGVGSVTISGTASDTDSGIKNVVITMEDTVIATIKPEDFTGENNNVWTATISDSSFAGAANGSSYTIYAKATDNAGVGNSKQISAGTITVDKENPGVENLTMTVTTGSDTSAVTKTVYSKLENSTTNYYLNNTDSGKTFKISGIATDNYGVKSVSLDVETTPATDPATKLQTQTINNPTGTWEFTIGTETDNWTGWATDGARATITVKDKAGNTKTDYVVINFDTTPPAGYHEADSLSKDLYFRIGDNDNDDIDSSNDTDVGKKYSDRTYGNSDTIEIRGKITDSASGVKMIYYYVFDKPVALDQSYTTPNQVVSADNIVVSGVPQNNVSCYGFKDKAALADWVISNKKGNFAPGTTVSKRVFYNVTGSNTLGGTRLGTTDKYWKNVDTNYRASLSGFENSSNFLVIAVEDNVGNRGLDYATVEDEDKVFCQINKDVTPPDVKLNTDEESIRYHNASSTGNSIILHGTVTDDLAGIRNLKFRVNGKFIPNEEENQLADRYGTIVPTYNENKTSGTWTLTIKPAALAGASDNISVYGIATDDAGAGNSQTVSVATICVDVTPPTVSITLPKDKGSAAGTQINGTISLSGTAGDRNGLKEETTTQTMKLYYTTSSDLSTALTNALNAYNAPDSTNEYPTITTGDDAANGWKEIASATHDTSWTSSTINTEDLEIENQATTPVYFTATAIDTAGNTGYALPVAVIVNQNTDRPIISFSNISFTDPETGIMSSSNYIWLKNTTKVIGTISDDDDSETGTNTLEIRLTGSDSDWHTVTLNGSSFSYDLKTLYTATATQTQEQLANGPKTLYFRVTDKKNKQFTSATTNTTSALYLSDGTNTYGDAASGAQAGSIVYVKVDTQYPEVALLGARYIEAANTTETSNATYSTTYSSFVIGETHRIFRVKFTASDTNGINDNSITGTATFPYGTGDSAGSIIVNSSGPTIPTEEANYYTLTFALTDEQVALLKADEGYDGSVNVRISVSDTAGNATPQTATMSYDFKPSVASFSNPDSSVSQSGEVEAYGSLSETATVSYKVTTSQTESATDEEWHTISDATGLNWTIHFDNNTNSANGTHAKSLNKYLIDYELAEHDTGSQAPDAIVSSYETFTTLYLWIKTVDHAGNEKKFNHPILVDPQGDKPNLQFSYPAANNGTLGGTISIYGTATDTKGSEANKIGVDSVWVQIKSTTHRAAEDTDTYGTSPSYASATNTVSMTLTEADLDYMVSNGYQVYKRRNYVVGAADSVNNAFKWTTSSNLTAGEFADDYAALANLNGAAWDIEINKKSISGRSEFDPPEGTNSNPIAIRVYARDKDGKFSSKVDRYVSFDADTPVISDLKVVQSADGNVNSTATATKTYSPDMFLKGPWYLTGTITDKEGIKELKVNGQTLITYTEPESEPNPVVRIVGGETEDTEDWRNAVSISENGGEKTIKFKYPLFTETQSGVSYSVPTTFTVSVKDKIKGNNAHPGSSSITINYDNTNPQVAEDEAHGLNIDTSIHQSNRWYKFGSKAMEPDDDNGTKQSGFAYTAFYFTRTSTNTLYDVLKDRNSAAISISGTIPVLGSANDTDNAIVTNNNLYWYHRTISNISGQTFTISNATAIRPSSLLQINGAFYLVTAVSGTSITVDSPVPAGSTVAYVAIAGIINNTTPEGDGTAIQTDGYYEAPSRDDGDRMIESVDKSGTTWAWEAKICSRNIPDGPIILHYIVFDKAGNSTSRTVSGMISNNQPRIAGAIVKTDFNGDGDVDDTGETINNYSTSLSYTSYYTGTKTTGTAPDTVTVNVFDPDENVKNTNAKNPLPTSTTYGSASEPITVLRGKTEIYPEIVGGNGALYYGYKVGDATTYTNNTTSPFITNGSTDYTVQTGIINIQHGDLIGFGDTTNAETGTPFVFKFWDSTAGGTRFDDAHPTQTAELTMYFAVQAQKVGNPWVKINPFYWNSLTDNSIYGSSTASAYKDLQGHIELEKDWKTTSVYDSSATSGLFDDDPKVSGKIVLSGTAHDDKLIKEMKVSIFGADPVEVASYSNGALSSTKTSADFNTNHYWFEVLSQTINSTGHDVSWKLYIDTATALSTVAGTDKSVTVTATNYGIPTASPVASTTPGALPGIDGTTYYAADLDYATGNTNTPGTSQTAKAKDAENNPILTAYYKMDVVPYITGIRTPNRSKSGLKDSNIRSASGKYSVIKGSTNNFITVTGFNLNVSGARIVKTERLSNLTEFTADDVSLEPTNKAEDFTSFQGRNNLTKSGYLEVLVNGVRALNNINNNNSHGSVQLAGATATVNEWNNFYNREPDYYSTKNVQLTDDRYILVWDMHDTGDRTKNGAYPTMFMEGDDPVFGYFNPSGGVAGAYGDGAGTGASYNEHLATNSYNSFPEYAMPQRIKFNSDGTEAYTEYLAKNSAGDQMGTGRDDSGRYYHMSVFNRGGCALYMIYDRYNEFYAKMGWAPGVQIGTPDNLVVSSDNNGIGLETINYGGLLAGRYQYPKIIAKGNSINGRAYVYVAYYDDYYHSIVMRNFRVGSTVTGNGTYALDSENKDLNGTTYTQRINFAENPTNRDNNSYGTGRLSGVGNVTGTPNANNSASKYFDMKVTSDYHIILVYYDETSSSLKLRYSTNPVTGNSPTTAIAWTESSVTFPEYVGNYVSLDLDSDDGLHMSAFDATDGNLVYMYLPSYSSTSLTKVTVDQASSVGNWTQIKLNSSDVPYIAYYNSTETGSRDSIKLAYAKNAAGSVTAGVDVVPGTISGTGYTLGGWEYMTVPSVNPAQGGNPNFQNVCLGFDTAGTPVVGYAAANLEFGKWLDE